MKLQAVQARQAARLQELGSVPEQAPAVRLVGDSIQLTHTRHAYNFIISLWPNLLAAERQIEDPL